MDKAQVYLQALQTGYRIDEYEFTTDGSGGFVTIAPFSMNRILLMISSIDPNIIVKYFKLDSGLLVPCQFTRSLEPMIFTMAMHYSLPTLEVVISNAVPGYSIAGLGIIKQ